MSLLASGRAEVESEDDSQGVVADDDSLDSQVSSPSSSSSESSDEDEYVPPEKRRKSNSTSTAQRLSVTVGTDFDTSKNFVADSYKVLLDSSSAETKAFFDNWSPSVPFQWLACRFSKSAKRGYFTNSLDVVMIISEELGYTATEFLNIRGWSFHRSKLDGTPTLRYHRFDSCLKHQPNVDAEKRDALTRHFNSMLAGLFVILKDAYAKFPSSSTQPFEKDFSTHLAFKSRINTHVQVYHLCYAATLMIFQRAASEKSIPMAQLVKDIFGKLRTKREIFSALHSMLQKFPDEGSIIDKYDILLQWLEQPTFIVRLLRQSESVLDDPQYKQQLTGEIDKLLPSQNKVGIVKAAVSGEDDPPALRAQQKKVAVKVAVVRLRVLQLTEQAEKLYKKGRQGRTRNKVGPADPNPPQNLPTIPDSSTPKPPMETPARPLDIVVSPFTAIFAMEPEPPIHFPSSLRDEGGSITTGSSGSSSFFSQAHPPTCEKEDADLMKGPIRDRFPSVQMATNKLLNDISCILVSEPEDTDTAATIVCQLSQLEVYFHSDLKTIPHRVSYIREEPHILALKPSRSVQWVPLSASVEGFNFAVFRKSHPLFQKHFQNLQCDFLDILEFLSCHGTTDAARDGDGESVGLRYDFGVGNQSYDVDGVNIVRGFHDPPKYNCGMAPLLAHSKAKSILLGLGSIADGVQQLFDSHMAKYAKAPFRHQDDKLRNDMFSNLLCGMLGCQHARYEWITILCKCLSAGHYVTNHLDKNNCSAEGYRHTANFSIVLMDSQNLAWRLSILFNLRQAASDYCNRENGARQFLSNIELYLSEVDKSYQTFIKETGGSGPKQNISTIGWRSYDKLFLCDNSPWKEYNLPLGGSVPLIELRAGVSRDLWMSMATHVLRLARAALVKKPHLFLELMLIALHQSGWLYLHLTISRMLKMGFLEGDDLVAGDVSRMYLETTNKLFGTFHCGSKTRFNVGGCDFDKVYVGNGKTLLDALSGLQEFLVWADMAVGVGPDQLQDRMDEVLPYLPGINYFRLQMFIPLCGLCGLLPRNLAIVDVCFPVEGRGSYKSLVEAGVKKERFGKYFSLISNHFAVDPRRTTWPEMMCCEMRDSRADATDVFIKDQSLSIITLHENGEYQLLVKEFNQLDWIVLQ